jgi:hypothetical protein
MAYRYDVSKGGVYDDGEDDKPPIAADTTAMPNAGPLALNQTQPGGAGGGGSSPPPATPLGVAGMAAAAGAIQPFTLNKQHWGTSKPVVTAQDALAQGEAANAVDEKVGAIQNVAEVESKGKTEEAGLHGQKAATYATQTSDLEKAAKRREEKLAAYDTKAAEIQKEIDGTTITDGFSNKSLGEKILIGLSLVVNGLGRGLAREHGPDQLFASIMERAKQDHDDQIRRLDAKRKLIEHLKGPAKEQAIKEWEADKDTISAKQIGANNQIGEQLNALAARTGSDQVIAKAGELAADAKAKGAEGHQAYLNSVRQKIETGGGRDEVIPSGAAAGTKAPTESEGKFAMYGRQMHGALNTIEALPPLSPASLAKVQDKLAAYEAAEKNAETGIGGAVTTSLGRTLGVLPRSASEGLTPDEQKALNAMDVYVNAAMRTESGAAIGVAENRKGFLRNMPVAGDSPEVRAQKLANARQTAEDFSVLGGAATTKLQAARAAGAPSVSPSAQPTSPPKHADAAADAAKVQKRLDGMKDNDPDRPRWEAILRHLKGGP